MAEYGRTFLASETTESGGFADGECRAGADAVH